MVRTRFAPSPTGYLHIGGARTALFSWAYARKHGGISVLRIEDTDVERSTAESTQAILDAMHWLGLDYDEGPFYQMRRLDRYRDVAEQLVREGKAYYAYESVDELNAMREAQIARGEKPRYDRRWRDSKDRPPANAKPVLRLKTPLDGAVAWDDLVKGRIVINNEELDDLVIVRADDLPTYNFAVVVDDLDMAITHVIRGDDHVNNTPRQINIFRLLGAELPNFAHVPMILGSDGERLSKRHGAVSVMQYKDDGYLPAALNNYLARLGWSHGDEEVFSMRQFVEWFELERISRSAAQFNPEKLAWLNQHYLKSADDAALGEELGARLRVSGLTHTAGRERLQAVAALLKTRVNTLQEMAQAAHYFFAPVEAPLELLEQHLSPAVRPVLEKLVQRFAAIDWTSTAIIETIKSTAAEHRLKLGQVGVPLRVAVCGTPQTPSLDATLALIGQDEVVARLQRQLARVK